MKKLIAATAVLALATACAEQAAEEPMAEDDGAEATAATAGVGSYEVTYADGSVGTMTRNEDGTFSSTVGEETGTGTVEDVDGKVCFDVEGDEEGAMCWTNSEAAEDGSFTSTSDGGDVVTVRPVAAEAEAEEEA